MHGVEVVPPRKEPIPGEPLKQPEVNVIPRNEEVEDLPKVVTPEEHEEEKVVKPVKRK